jgi:hypothetical protein
MERDRVALRFDLALDASLKKRGKVQMRILVIDGASARDLMVEVRTVVGHDVVEARDSVEGLRLNTAESQRF